MDWESRKPLAANAGRRSAVSKASDQQSTDRASLYVRATRSRPAVARQRLSAVSCRARRASTALSIGANFGVHSHWLLPASLLGLSGMATAFFNPPVQATMVAALPRTQWGIGTGIIHSIFGLGHLLGISLTGLVLTLAFRYYSGVSGIEPGPQNPIVFVAAINIVFVAAMVIGLMSLVSALCTTHKPVKA